MQLIPAADILALKHVSRIFGHCNNPVAIAKMSENSTDVL